MGKVLKICIVVAITVSFVGCGPKPKSPISGADLVATAVSAKYAVEVETVSPGANGYDWSISAANGSNYAWKGKLTVKLLDAEKKILESHNFAVPDMVDPGGVTTDLKFQSPQAPVELGGKVTGFKVEVAVADYKEAPAQ